jgi:GNAT superfamily N-acetyltransferase
MKKGSLSTTCILEPANLHDPDQFTELQRQRTICGWFSDPQTLQKWKQKQEENLKALFWITITVSEDEKSIPVRAGHIALDAYCSPPNPDLARADKSVLAISSFFILPEYRSYGLGRHAMRLIEEMAVVEPYGSPRCRLLTLNALSKRYVYDEGPEWRGLWGRLGVERPAFSIQEWYESLGYVSWKEEPLYEARTLDGEVVRLWEAFMRKEVRGEASAIVD